MCLKILPPLNPATVKFKHLTQKYVFFPAFIDHPRVKKNTCKFSTFISEFNELCEHLSSEPNVYFFGDFNLHFEDLNDPPVREFKNLINEHDFQQCVNGKTHINGHTLDLCLYRCSDTAFTDPPYVEDICLSDHFVITASLPFSKPKLAKNMIKKRNTKNIDLNAFKCALHDTLSENNKVHDSFSLHECITSVLNKFAPIKNKLTLIRPAAPWINLVVKAQKQIKRQAERLYKKTLLTVHKQILKYQKNKTIKIINDEKKKYISENIADSNNSKQLYSIFNKITGKNHDLILPSDTPIQTLPNLFNEFFVDKISKIRVALDSVNIAQSANTSQYNGKPFNIFSSVTTDYVKKVILNSKKSFSELDSLPGDIFIHCLDTLLPYITNIFNESLSSGVFPLDFKTSFVIPLLKKPSLDRNSLKNYRPVSNLSFVSKVLERIVFNQIVGHLQENSLIEKFQSAYKAGHSTETALLRVVNDLLCDIDDGNVCLLTMLDLSAAFDTLDFDILFERLSSTFGISQVPLEWFKSYLSNRQQKVKIREFYSDQIPLSFGVPQGSVLGPLLFTMYIYPISDVIDKKLFNYHQYADDTQLYTSFKPDSISTISDKLSISTSEINDWMTSNKLKMNKDKTEILLCGTNPKLKNITLDTIKIGEDLISLSCDVKDLGVFIDGNISFNSHVSHIRKCCYGELRRISNIRPFIDEGSAVQLAVSLILSKLDYCNCLFYDMTNENFHKLQLIQNHAARLVKKANKRSSATSLLKDLHWLPVKQRVLYKIALIVFKCLNVENFPPYLKELISIYKPSRTLRSSDKLLLDTPYKKLTTFGQRSFAYSAPKVWNGLPFHLRSCTSLIVFKKSLKTHFFRIAFP